MADRTAEDSRTISAGNKEDAPDAEPTPARAADQPAPALGFFERLRHHRVAQWTIIAGLIAKHKWLLVDSRPPAPRRDGTLEVVVRTPIMGFREDLVIRVRQVGEGTRVDVRSASRYGFHDMGSNAQRVRALIEEIDEAVANAPEPRTPTPAQPALRTPQQPEKKPAPANRRQ